MQMHPNPFQRRFVNINAPIKSVEECFYFDAILFFCARYLNLKQIRALVCHSGGALCSCMFLYGYGALYYICCLFSHFAYEIL